MRAALLLALVALAGLTAACGSSPSVVRHELRYGTDGGQPLLLDAYLPSSSGRRRPAVILVHGGWWRQLDKSYLAPEARRIAAELGWVAFSINYRLDASSAFPAERDDVLLAVRFVREHADRLGVDPARLGLLGESAGGNLAALAATLGPSPRVRAVVSWSGFMDLAALQGESATMAHLYLGCAPGGCPGRYAAASPLAQVDSTTPPMLIVNAAHELVPLAQAEEMAARLRAAGVPYRLVVVPGGRHAKQYEDRVWQTTVQFLERYLASDGEPRTNKRSSGRPMR